MKKLYEVTFQSGLTAIREVAPEDEATFQDEMTRKGADWKEADPV